MYEELSWTGHSASKGARTGVRLDWEGKKKGADRNLGDLRGDDSPQHPCTKAEPLEKLRLPLLLSCEGSRQNLLPPLIGWYDNSRGDGTGAIGPSKTVKRDEMGLDPGVDFQQLLFGWLRRKRDKRSGFSASTPPPAQDELA